MNHYYLYIQAGVRIDPSTRFYKVAIGETTRMSKVRTWLEAYAVEHGHLFVRWSIDARDFYGRCIESVGVTDFPLVTISGTALMRSLKAGLDDPALWSAVQARHELLLKIDPHYYTYHQLSRK